LQIPDLSLTNYSEILQIYRLYRLKKWKRIYTQGYDPLEGFIVEGGLGRILVGDYNCSSASTNSSIIIVVVDVSEKEKCELAN
jgi:hypothetical protein